MKNNTGRSKELLLQTIRNIPNDFALSEVRFHLNVALRKMEDVEGKRRRRSEIEAQQDQQRRNDHIQFINPKDALDRIEAMIEEEKIKLEQMQNKKKKDNDQDLDLDDMQTILG